MLPLKHYSGSTMGNLPIGQGIAVTPMQMAAAYSAIANGGILRAPHIVASVGGKTTTKPTGKRVISEATAASVRTMLEGVLGPGGTASGAAIQGYDLAGKTGTAEKAIPGGYSKDKYVASFVGFAPAEHPKLLAAVMVDEPKGEIYGGQVAAPAWREHRQLRAGLPEDLPELELDLTACRGAVENQSVPFEDVDLFALDPAAAARRWSARAAAGRPSGCARRASSPRPPRRQAHGRRAERNEPRLVTHDRFGHRVDQVELDPSWHWLLDGAVAREIHALPWAIPGRARTSPAPRWSCCGRTPTPA